MDSCTVEKARFITVEGEKLHYVIDALAPQKGHGFLMNLEHHELSLIDNARRKTEYKAIRSLKNRFFNTAHIQYLPNGKPSLTGSSNHIGISHSKNLAVFAFSAVPFGCDIEEKNPRLFRVEQRFTGFSETSLLAVYSPLDCLCILWACKEAVFKLTGFVGIRWKDQCLLYSVQIPILKFQLSRKDDIIIVDCHIEQVHNFAWVAFAYIENHESII
jgi:phosphopantetheinyl transferase